MTAIGTVLLMYLGALALIALVAIITWVVVSLDDWTARRRSTRPGPKTEDMLDEFSRLAITRERREKETKNPRYYSTYDAEGQIREFLRRRPDVQWVELEKARKHEYVHTTAAEMMLKHDPERSAARIAELEAALYPQPARRRRRRNATPPVDAGLR